MSVNLYAVGFFTTILMFALWLEYRHMCRCRKNKPYELIDFQREVQKRKDREGW